LRSVFYYAIKVVWSFKETYWVYGSTMVTENVRKQKQKTKKMEKHQREGGKKIEIQ